MEQNHKLTIDIFGTAEYATDEVPALMIELLKKNPNFSAVITDPDNVFLIGNVNQKKIAVICGKESYYADFVRMVDNALNEACDLIFASTPHHADKYDYLKRKVTGQGHYLIETSPLFMKIAPGHTQDPALQNLLTEKYANLLINLIHQI